MSRRLVGAGAVVAAVLIAALGGGSAGAARPPDPGGDGRGVAEHWTPDRMAAAQPRDLVLDERGLAYLRRADGSLAPYGHGTPAEAAPLRAVPAAKPDGGGGKPGGGGSSPDTTGPEVTELDPAAGATIGGTHTFGATVTDVGSGVRSVTFVLTPASGGTSQSFAASRSGDRWSVTLEGFQDGQQWTWHVVAKDNAKRGGNSTTTADITFSVSISGTGGGGGASDVVANAEWTSGGDVQTAAGRIYFEMPTNGPNWGGYVCSGTVVADVTTDRSVILTAAHCVYDDVSKVFARNVLFIPDQAGSASGTDRDCGNDPLGCWAPSFGVVDDDWASRTFPANIPWDYGYYVVPDAGSHSGTGGGADLVLDAAVPELTVDWSTPTIGELAHALGYSYSDDPNFMYCADGLGTESSYGDWWLPSCGLSGGSSGGPWLQPASDGNGPVISVNSWGYTNEPGMAGPRLADSSAQCVMGGTNGDPTTDRGAILECP